MCSRALWLFKMKIFLILVIVMCLGLNCANCHRVKRKVLFSKNSKIFMRLNGKDNVIPWVQIFACGWTVRVNWDLPDTLNKRHRFFKRDIHTEIENVKNSFGSQGYSCLLNYVCNQFSLIANSKKCGVFCEIGKIIQKTSGIESDFFKSIISKCDYYRDQCEESL